MSRQQKLDRLESLLGELMSIFGEDWSPEARAAASRGRSKKKLTVPKKSMAKRSADRKKQRELLKRH